MNLSLGEGVWAYVTILLIAVLAHEPWRWFGMAIGLSINPNGEVFRWVKAVSTALVCALCARLILFPAGALATVDTPIRVGAFVAGLAAFFLTGRTLWVGVLVGTGVITVGKLLATQ